MTDTVNEPARAFISLGANLPSSHGSPQETLQKAAEFIAGFSSVPVRLSSFWQSEPLNCPPDSPVYTNAVLVMTPVSGETSLSLLYKLQQVEHEFGRVRTGLVNEARVLDLDLIAFGGETCDTPELVLPHPRAHERLFVLLPLQELCPEFLFPDREENLDQLISELTDQVIFRVP